MNSPLKRSGLPSKPALFRKPANMNNTINIIQWNCQGIRKKIGELVSFLNTLKVLPDIILIQETFLKNRHPFKLPGYQVERLDRKESTNGGGLMTCIREGISFCSSAISEDPECLMTTILLKSRKLQIINFYAPPRPIYSRTDLEKILSHRNSIICVDINAYSPIFGAQYSDTRGKIVEDIILINDLVTLDTGEGTHHTRSGKCKPLDISLVSYNFACRSSWKVLPENLGRDHFLIHITIDGTILHEDSRVHRINLKKVDWKLYQLTCLASLGPDLPTDDLERNTTFISKCIVEAAETSSPKPKNCTRKQLVPYWNDDCRSAIKERNQKRNRFLKSRTDESLIEYKRAKGRAQWVIKTAKRECWQRFCSSFNKSTNLGILRKSVKSMSGHSRGACIPPISSIDGSPQDNLGKAEMLAKTIAHASSNANLSPAFTNLKRELTLDLDLERTDNSSLSYPIYTHEVVDALGKCGNSSPGPDGIHYEMIRRLPRHVSKALFLYLISPDRWVVFLPPGRKRQ